MNDWRFVHVQFSMQAQAKRNMKSRQDSLVTGLQCDVAMLYFRRGSVVSILAIGVWSHFWPIIFVIHFQGFRNRVF